MSNRALCIAIAGKEEFTCNYRNALCSLGAEPVLLRQAQDMRADGLLLPGGDDVNPSRYGQENRGSEGIDDALDEWQLAAIDAFVKAGKPVFGICRGIQIVNVYFGGSLIQDLDTNWRHQRENGKDKVHLTTADEDSWLAALYGTEFRTNSAHHQAADRIGKGLRVVQRAEDGTVEAFVHETLPVYCVQWHPERMCFAHRRADTVDGSIVLKHFLNICRHYRKS